METGTKLREHAVRGRNWGAGSRPPWGCASLQQGDTIEDRYLLERLIGTGGMGQVWAARHIVLDRPVALKLVLIDLQETRARLLQEARVLATLKHPAIVEVFDFGEHLARTPYIVMELLEGESLEMRIRRHGPLSAEWAVRLLLPLLGGLESAHRRGVVHRDIKPANVLLEQRAGSAFPTARLLDFGIAFIGRSGSSRITGAGGVVGTPNYMAPEQFRGREVDGRADVWGMGITLFECLTGDVPFGAADPVAVMARVVHGQLVRPAGPPMLDEALWAILTRALAKSETDRYPSASAFGDALATWLEGRSQPTLDAVPIAAAPPPEATSKPPSRSAVALVARPFEITDDAPPSLDALIRSRLSGS